MKRNIKAIFIFYTTLFAVIFLITQTGCKKEEESQVVYETGTMTDIDNNVYKTVKIGSQWWMAENLKVKSFRNGIPLIQRQTVADWTQAVSSYCIYNDNDGAPGLLYNWYAINDSNNIAPPGWHIPSDSEWMELEQYLGISQSDANKKGWRGTHEGEKLKIEGTEGWTDYPGVWSTNESGFTALAGSCRLFNGTWGDPGLFATGFWWTSSSHSNVKDSWYRYMDYKNAKIFRSYCDIKYGMSIRCVKD